MSKLPLQCDSPCTTRVKCLFKSGRTRDLPYPVLLHQLMLSPFHSMLLVVNEPSGFLITLQNCWSCIVCDVVSVQPKVGALKKSGFRGLVAQRGGSLQEFRIRPVNCFLFVPWRKRAFIPCRAEEAPLQR